MGKGQFKHGDARREKETRLYGIWRRMKSRCTNPNNKDYKYYGGNGITFCEEWNDYSNFKNWAINNGYKDNLTIDRKDGSKNYCPENCRWITIEEQQSNKCNNHLLSYQGETMTINQWAERLGINREIIKDRLLLGWSTEKTLTTPIKKRKNGIEYNGEVHSWRKWSEITNIPYKTLINRFYDSHWSIERTLTEPVHSKTSNN